MRADKKITALFDLDGTLLPWDTQCLFLNFILKRHPWRRLLMLFYLAMLPLYVVRLVDETFMKRAFLVYMWKMSPSLLNSYAEAFAEEVCDHWVYGEMLSRVEWHRKRGDDLWLVTASPSVYAQAIGRQLGFTQILSTEVDVVGAFPLLPNLTWGNNKGKTKVDRLEQLHVLTGKKHQEQVLAYSDSIADLPMLQAAENQFLVNPSTQLISQFQQETCDVVRPLRPWSSRSKKLLFVALYFLGLRKF